MTNSEHFLQIAASIADADAVPELSTGCLRQARDGFGGVPESIDVLLDRKNWTAAKPQIRVFATINRKNSFVVRWVPTVGTYDARTQADLEFDHYFVREVEMAEGIGSSINLLVWFREPPVILPSSRANSSRTAVLSIAAGLKARYEELLDRLRQDLLVTSATSLAILTDNDRVEYQFGREGRAEYAESIAKGLTAPSW
ncbi:hypothetical protein [Mesorhizobium sp. B2-5-3]|uniref:hypothetical protein n=1 Tax=Mesorhizobium sp. B2-5-3 TaxID=2589927 RepID=UPI00112BD2FB|nr:hypothetical protein [Mesorhizobium sp. B2-5-3]TPK36356.1 hypothetical protein FJ867_14920 [Mesorhizobium sp. B2-5-3]